MSGPDRARSRLRSGSGAAAEQAAADPASPGEVARPAGPGAAGDRPVPLRLAHLHLRMGSLLLARAELESLAGRAMLDEDSMLDLAEVRWRTGDLAGAGEAANALLARGREDALALVIAAESVAAQGRPGEARKLAGRATEAAGGSLDPLFAGIPRSTIWPVETPDPGASPAGSGGKASGRRAPAAPGRADTARGAARPAEPASTGAAEAYAGGRAALGAGDTTQAAVRLGVALRLEPGFARDVLDAIGDQAGDPALALVVGDALRLLGRESEALDAYDRARGQAHDPAAVDDQSTGAGDDELG